MSCRSKQYSKRKKKKYKEDMHIIELLNAQALAINIYLISDILYYIFGVMILELTYKQDEHSNWATPYLILMKATYLALAASMISSKIDFLAYDRVSKKKSKGIIDYSIEPERKIALSSLYVIILFYIDLIGIIKIYKQQITYNKKLDRSFIPILNIQVISFKMRIFADCMSLIATRESVDLIKSKYDGRKSENLRNPDIPDVIAAILYLIERIMLCYVNYMRYLYAVKNSSGSNAWSIIEPLVIRVLANTVGVAGNMLALDAFIEAYHRNIILPVFGR